MNTRDHFVFVDDYLSFHLLPGDVILKHFHGIESEGKERCGLCFVPKFGGFHEYNSRLQGMLTSRLSGSLVEEVIYLILLLSSSSESCTTQAASSLHEVEEDSSLSASAGWSDPSLSGSWRATYICILERSETHKIFQKMFPPHQVYYDALRLRGSQVSPSL